MISKKHLKEREDQILEENYEKFIKFWRRVQSKEKNINQTCSETTNTVIKIGVGNDCSE